MERRSLHLLQLLLLFSFIHLIISSTAVDSSKIRRAMQGVKVTPFRSEYVQVSNTELKAKEDEASRNDRVLDIEDYPGSGANNRHSPPSDGN